MKQFDFSYLGDKRYLNFRNMFFLFMIGSVIGTIGEGIWSFLFFYSPVVLCFIPPLPPYILFILLFIINREL